MENMYLFLWLELFQVLIPFPPLLYVDLHGQLHANVNHLENFKVVSLQCISTDSWSCRLFFTSGNPRLTEVKPLH